MRDSRYLRQNLTLAERLLWPRLRQLKYQGLHFRRQTPIGNYIVDFACHKAKLIVELDGSQHGEPAQTVRDEVRTKFLNSQGYRVLRYWNADVLRDSIAVAETIFAEARTTIDERIHAAKTSPHPARGMINAPTDSQARRPPHKGEVGTIWRGSES